MRNFILYVLIWLVLAFVSFRVLPVYSGGDPNNVAYTKESYSKGSYYPLPQVAQKSYVEQGADKWKQVIVWLGDTIGYGWLVLAIVLGGVMIFRKKVKEWL